MRAYDAKGGLCYQVFPGTVCQEIAFPATVGPSSQITVAAGRIFGPGPGQLAIAEVY